MSLDSDIGAIKLTAFDGAALRVILEVVPFMSIFCRKEKEGRKHVYTLVEKGFLLVVV